MSEICDWMKNVVCCLCLLELLYHLVRSEEYQRYLRFFGGMVFLLITLGPLLDVFRLQEKLDGAFRDGMRKEKIWELQESADSLMDLQNEKIREACVGEFERQIRELIENQGVEVLDAEAKVDMEKTGWDLTQVEISVKADQSVSEEGDRVTVGEGQIRNTVSAVYGLPEDRILVNVKE